MANNNIYQGDNGTTFSFTVTDESGVVPLTEVSTIEVKIKSSTREIIKNCTVIDALNGKCQTILTSSDLNDSGNYALQLTVSFNDGKSFKSSIGRFAVEKSL